MNIQQIYENFSKNNDDPDNFVVTKAGEQELKALTCLYENCCEESCIWDAEDLEYLKELKIPPQLIEFYKKFNPINVPMNDAEINLADLNGIKEEYLQNEPGCFLIRWGFLVFATTIGGNSVIVDLNCPKMPVYLSDFNLLYCKGVPGNMEIMFSFPSKHLMKKYGETVPVNEETLKQSMVLAEESFETFINNLSENKYGILEDLLDAEEN